MQATCTGVIGLLGDDYMLAVGDNQQRCPGSSVDAKSPLLARSSYVL